MFIHLAKAFAQNMPFSHSNHEASITLIPKTLKEENYQLIPLKNIGTKILTQMAAYWIQKHIKYILHHDQVVFTPEMQGWFKI